MLVNLDPQSRVPIYLQIAEQIRLRIAGGLLSVGEQVQPVKELAMSLKISPLTISRAYAELEREGTLIRRGSEDLCVAENQRDTKQANRESMLKAMLKESMVLAQALGFSETATQRIVGEAYRELHKTRSR